MKCSIFEPLNNNMSTCGSLLLSDVSFDGYWSASWSSSIPLRLLTSQHAVFLVLRLHTIFNAFLRWGSFGHRTFRRNDPRCAQGPFLCCHAGRQDGVSLRAEVWHRGPDHQLRGAAEDCHRWPCQNRNPASREKHHQLPCLSFKIVIGLLISNLALNSGP